MNERDHLGDWSPEKDCPSQDSNHPDDLSQSRSINFDCPYPPLQQIGPNVSHLLTIEVTNRSKLRVSCFSHISYFAAEFGIFENDSFHAWHRHILGPCSRAVIKLNVSEGRVGLIRIFPAKRFHVFSLPR